MEGSVSFRVTWPMLWNMLVAVLTTRGMVRINVSNITVGTEPEQPQPVGEKP